MAKKNKRVVVISDLHCGHAVGLTPPDWQSKHVDKFSEMRAGIWDFYASEIKALQNIDLLVLNGDALDGKGERSGGTELIEPEIAEQQEMAEVCINQAGAKSIVIVAGTPYHTGVTSDNELAIAKHVGAEFSSHLFADVNGCIFDCKHFINGSIIPHGRLTALERDKVWNDLWSLDEGQPRANVVIRSHVHYYKGIDDPEYMSFITPALMGFGSKYGARKCSGKIYVGFISFDVTAEGAYSCQKHLLKAGFLKVEAVKF
jgi:hypothetical protein